MKTLSKFAKYLWDFYGPEGVYEEFFVPALSVEEIEKGIEEYQQQNPESNLDKDGDSIDREMIRDIMLQARLSK